MVKSVQLTGNETMLKKEAVRPVHDSCSIGLAFVGDVDLDFFWKVTADGEVAVALSQAG
jgi:hypothetical protein